MKSYEVLRQAFKPVGCKNVATELACSLSLIYQWSRGRDGRSEARNPLEVLRRIVQHTGDVRPLEWLCAQAGGRFVRGKELRSLICQDCERKIAELKAIMESGDGSGQLGLGKSPKLPPANSQQPSRCRYWRAGGRCGFDRAQRN